MFAIDVTTPGKLDVVDVLDPTLGPYEARIRTELAALCNLTDRKVIEDHFPGVGDYPLLLGHETVGLVDEVGEKVRNFKAGDRVVGALVLNTPSPASSSGWGGFCEWTIAGDHRAMVEDGVADPENNWNDVYEIMTVVPPDIPVEAAVMLCTWREVLGSMADFGLVPGTDPADFWLRAGRFELRQICPAPGLRPNYGRGPQPAQARAGPGDGRRPGGRAGRHRSRDRPDLGRQVRHDHRRRRQRTDNAGGAPAHQKKRLGLHLRHSR
jgi:hypothetical protein